MSVTVLAVGLPEEDERSLTKIAARDDLSLRKVKTMAEALTYMPVPVVVCEDTLPDGDWKALLEESSHWRNPPRVIVTSPLADEALWAEVLNLGGYDVLAEPLQSEEVRRVLNLASHS